MSDIDGISICWCFDSLRLSVDSYGTSKVKSSQLQAQTVGTVPMVSMVPVIPQVSPVPFLAATMGAPIASIGHTGHVPHASSGRIFFGNVPFATWMENDLSYYEVLSFELFWNGLASSKSLAKVCLKYWSAKQHGNWKASLFTYHVRICPYCF